MEGLFGGVGLALFAVVVLAVLVGFGFILYAILTVDWED